MFLRLSIDLQFSRQLSPTHHLTIIMKLIYPCSLIFLNKALAIGPSGTNENGTPSFGTGSPSASRSGLWKNHLWGQHCEDFIKLGIEAGEKPGPQPAFDFGQKCLSKKYIEDPDLFKKCLKKNKVKGKHSEPVENCRNILVSETRPWDIHCKKLIDIKNGRTDGLPYPVYAEGADCLAGMVADMNEAWNEGKDPAADVKDRFDKCVDESMLTEDKERAPTLECFDTLVKLYESQGSESPKGEIPENQGSDMGTENILSNIAGQLIGALATVNLNDISIGIHINQIGNNYLVGGDFHAPEICEDNMDQMDMGGMNPIEFLDNFFADNENEETPSGLHLNILGNNYLVDGNFVTPGASNVDSPTGHMTPTPPIDHEPDMDFIEIEEFATCLNDDYIHLYTNANGLVEYLTEGEIYEKGKMIHSYGCVVEGEMARRKEKYALEGSEPELLQAE